MNKYFTNQEIAELLRRVESAYEVKGENRFKIRAYDTAAASVEHSTSELKDLWDEGKLDQVPGVGKSIAQHLDELFRTNKVKHFEKVMQGLPPAMFALEKIPGVGPKRALVLAKELKITEEKEAVEKLKEKALAGEVKKLEGFGEKLEQDLLRGIDSYEKGEVETKRMPLYFANELAEELINYLKKNPEVVEAYPLGSLRRKLATVGDIDIAVSTNKPEEVLNYFFKYPKIQKVLDRGEKDLGRVTLQNGQQVDIRTSLPESFGAMLQHFTGSKQHNIALREFALSKGKSLSEYGIKKLKTVDNRQKPESRTQITEQKFKNEIDFYQALGLDYIPPEIREDTGEIEASLKHNLPNLVELKDIKGDLHLHSDFPIEPSHDEGVSSLKAMVEMGERLNYQYLGFTEHNPSTSKHKEDKVINLLKRKKDYFDKFIYSYENAVKERRNKLPIKIFNGLEIDIKPSGELSIPDKAFEFLDYAIASVHSSFDLNKEKMTQRVIRGLSHPKVKILGHPTGRKINEREGYELDWEKIFDFCLRNNKFLEISAWPNRLDLPDFLVREAVTNGVKLVINSDSHAVDQMDLMKYGVAVAKRGWAEKKDILNTCSLDEVERLLFF
ncbi:MAG: PHP domain-containing protein [Patescibacteria group bacterium]|nr:PHP domain-containing protein [Patescibacteria group bacterium]